MYPLSPDGHMNRGIFYNNECIKIDHFMVHLLMQRGDELTCKIMKALYVSLGDQTDPN